MVPVVDMVSRRDGAVVMLPNSAMKARGAGLLPEAAIVAAIPPVFAPVELDDIHGRNSTAIGSVEEE
jgi:hypothetical protein